MLKHLLARLGRALTQAATHLTPNFEVIQDYGHSRLHIAHVRGQGYLAYETTTEDGEVTEVRGSFEGFLTRDEARDQLLHYGTPDAVAAFDRSRDAVIAYA